MISYPQISDHKNIFSFLCDNGPLQPATNYWRSFEIAEVIRQGLPSGRGLDVGCGDGLIMQYLLGVLGNRDVTGVDIDPHETALARSRGIYRDVLTTPASDLPLDSDHFDFAFSNSVLEHIPELQPVLNEVGRTLKPGGSFIFTVPNEHFHDNLSGPFIFSKQRNDYLDKLDKRCAHVRYWSIADWEKALALAGLQFHKHTFYLSREQIQRWENIARFSSGILFWLFGSNSSPIEIQRTLQVRQHSSPFITRLLSSLFSSLWYERNRICVSKADSTCYLIVARKG